MDTDIVMSAAFWQELQAHLIRLPAEAPAPKRRRLLPKRVEGYLPALAPIDEQLAYILASSNRTTHGIRLLAREMLCAGKDDFAHQSAGGLEPRPDFVLRALNRCRSEGWHLIEVHSHPFSTGPGTTFSGIDWNNDRRKMPAIATLMQEDFIHATMVVGQDSLDAHVYDRATKQILPIRQVVIVGAGSTNGQYLYSIPTSSVNRFIPNPLEPSAHPLPSPHAGRGRGWGPGDHDLTRLGIIPLSNPDPERAPAPEMGRYHRQELLFGRDVQRKLQQTAVAVVGLGGLGSFVALELAHLGVGHLVLIDPDTVDETNLNRLIGARAEDIDQAKVEVYARLVRGIAPGITLAPLPYAILDERALAAAKGADVLAGCVDNHGARMILNQLAVRYLIPLVDGGSGIRPATDAQPLAIGGQVQLVLPGMGCLECRGAIDARRAAFDLAPAAVQAEERAHGYGIAETAPAVIALNGVIASMQVTEILALLAPALATAAPVPPISLYNALTRAIVPMLPHASADCPTCGPEGVLAVGDLAPIQQAQVSDTPSPIPMNMTGGNDDGS
jgi:molybdopterin/thiamine biosynthesis adenylyltransferase